MKSAVREELADSQSERNRMVQIAGSFISAVRDACRNGLLDWSPRLMLAMYECDIQASSESHVPCHILGYHNSFAAEVLGKVYGVVARRRGKIVAEEMKEGTTFFTIRSLLPVVESFGFPDGKPHAMPCRKCNLIGLAMQKYGSVPRVLQVRSLFSAGMCY